MSKTAVRACKERGGRLQAPALYQRCLLSAFRHLPILALHIDISAKPSKIDIVSIYYLCLRAVNELDWSDSE